MTVSTEAYRELAQACQLRAAERDKYWGDLLMQCADDHERRIKIAGMLGVHCDYGTPPGWDFLMVRLNECLTTFRRKVA